MITLCKSSKKYQGEYIRRLIYPAIEFNSFTEAVLLNRKLIMKPII